MVNRQFDWEYVAIGLLGTALVMVLILGAGLMLSNEKVKDLRNDIKNIEVDQQSQLLTFELSENIEGQQCKAMEDWVDNTVQDTRDLRQKVAAYESSRKIRNSDYENLKKRYLNLLVQNLIEVRKLEERCGQNMTEVVYFYTNQDCSACKDQGTVLTYVQQNFGENVVVYPLDTDFDIQSVNYLENAYNITRYPSIVVEGEIYEGFQSRQKLETVVENQTQ